MRELYAEYRAFAVPKGKPRFENVRDELRLLQSHAPTYETLEGRIEADPTIAWLGKKLSTWQVTTAYPIAFQIAASDLSDESRKIIARVIYSYIVRRALCGLTTKNLNNVFQSIAESFIRNEVSLECLIAFFSNRSGDSTRFPDDSELHRGILSSAAYRFIPSRRIKDILWELELASRPKFSEKTEMPSDLWTEHVLPVSWSEEWPMPDGDLINFDSEDSRVAERDHLLHTLGNLTLMTSGLNRSSGNKSFSEKREKLEEHSSLYMNKPFLKKDSWCETDIIERGSELAEKAVRIWAEIDS